MPKVELDGTTLYYEVDGTGPPMMVLHGGLGLDHHIYRRTLAPLAEHFQLIFPDQRGNGRSTTNDLESITMPQLADDALALADHLGLERFSVLGHSYGGFVAQELALRHGERLDTLVLVDTTPGQLGHSEGESDDRGPEPPPEVIAILSTVPTTDDEMAASMERLFPAYFHRPDRFDLPALAEGTVFRAATMVRGFEVLGTWSSMDRLPELDVPALVIAGRHDVFTSFPQAYRIANRVPNSTVVVFEHSGHFPWIEEAERFRATLLAWHATNRR